MLESIVSGFNALLDGLDAIYQIASNMFFAIVQLPIMAVTGSSFLVSAAGYLPSCIGSLMLFGIGISVVQWFLPGEIGGS